MSEILIDGYNLLRASERLVREELKSLENGRDALILMLSKYKLIKGHTVTVVFDGQEGSPSAFFKSGVRVIFTSFFQKADDKIKLMTVENKNRFIVVTSDRDIINTVRRNGAAVISSAEFLKKMESAFYESDKGIIEDDNERNSPKNRKGLSLRLPKRDRLERRRLNKL